MSRQSRSAVRHRRSSAHQPLERLESRQLASTTPLVGVGIGSSGSYRGQGNTFAKALDGNLGTYFDGTTGKGQWVGLDVGAGNTSAVTQVSYAPRPGWAGRMVGGVLQASNAADFSAGTVTLYTVATAPATGKLTVVPVTAAGTFEYFRFLSPSTGFGNVAEVQFAADDSVVTTPTPPPTAPPTPPVVTPTPVQSPTPTPTPPPTPPVVTPTPTPDPSAALTGTAIGSPGSYRGQGNTAAKALDGSLSTYFDGTTANGMWVGLDLGAGNGAAVTQVSYAPRPGFASRMVGGTFQASNVADFSVGTVSLYTVTATPAVGKLTTVAVASPGTYRYVRYLSPAGGYGNVAEVQFAGTATTATTAAPTITGWASGAASPVARAEAVGTVVNGVVYVFGGLVNEGSVDTSIPLISECDAYTPATNKWKRLADFPEPFSHSEPVVIGTNMWFVGGYVGNHPGPGTTHVWVYDTTADTWTRGPDLPVARGAGAAAAIGDTIYFTGGMDETRTTDEATTFALDTDNPAAGWAQKADLPNARNHVAAAAVGGYFYVIGGQHGQEDGQAAQSEVDRYDPATDTWTTAAALPVNAGKSHITSGTFAYNGRIIVVGGETGYNDPQRAVMSYDPTTNTWTTIGLLPAARSTVVAGIVDGKLVVTTGNSPYASNTTWIGTFST